jgi:hypothetical protein
LAQLELTCPRRLNRCHQLYSHSQRMQKAAIQRSAEGAGQVQRVCATRSSETAVTNGGGWRARVKRLKTATVFRSPRTLTTARPSRCDDTPKKVKHQLLVSRWMGERAYLRYVGPTACDWQSIVGSKGRCEVSTHMRGDSWHQEVSTHRVPRWQ